MGKNQCLAWPLVNNGPSTMYKEILKLTKNKALANYIYAAYLQTGVAAQMDSRGKKRNKQNQHSAKDVMEFFDVASMQNETTHLYTAELNLSKDSSGNTINYTDANEALDKARTFNESSKGFVASVVQVGDHFNIVVNNKDARTQVRASEVREQQLLWDTMKQAFNAVGIDIETLSAEPNLVETINPIKGVSFPRHLNNLKLTRNANLSRRDIILLLKINESSSQVQRLMTKWGTIDDVAQKIYDNYRTRGGIVTASEASLIEIMLNQCKRYNGLDVNALENQLNQESSNFKSTSEEESIQSTLRVLDKKYDISAEEIHIIGKEITSLSQAAANAAVTIQRQIDKIESERGLTPDVKRLETILKQLMQELKSQHYYAGCLNFLSEANNQVLHIIDLLNNLPTTGTTLEIASANSKALLEIQSIKNAYYDIINAISHIDSITIEESISDADKATLRDKASLIKKEMDRVEMEVLRKLRISTMTDIVTEVLGNTVDNGIPTANLVLMAESDSSIWDYLYSVGRTSNKLIASMGSIIRDAQDSRDKVFNEIEVRIRRANHKLTKAGYTSEFMYDSNGYIISDIDWDSYKKAKNKARIKYKQSGLRGFALKEAMDIWEENNTEDRIVDFSNSRTEKVPNSSYRKPFPVLAPEQLDYYNEMMQLKGELGSLLPHYAQKQYLPPQLRRSFLDAVENAKSAKDVVKAIWNKVKDIWTKREDDTEFIENAVIDGDDYGITQGDFNNNPVRVMPIFFVRKLKEQDELLKDFSSALQALAGTAVNYDAMSQVREIVEFMGDFIKDQKIHANYKDKKSTEIVVEKGIKVFKDLFKLADNSNTTTLIDSFIAQHLYGIKLKDQGKWAKLAQSILTYTSIRSLAVNLKGMISNALVGETQILIEAGTGEFYNLADWAWAKKTLFGDLTGKVPGKIIDFFTNNKNSYDSLLADIFDPIPGGFEKRSRTRYYNSFFRHLVSIDLTFLGYQAGEYALHYTGMYAILHNTKVMIDGKKSYLYHAFKKEPKEDGNTKLVLKDNVTDMNGNPVDQEFIDSIRKRIRYANQSTQGAMNDEDKGVLQQRMWGKFIMNFRQWMVEYYSKRYRGPFWDATLKMNREGYWYTARMLAKGYANDYLDFKFKTVLHSSEMNDMQKKNIRRLVVEHAILGSLYLLSMALGEPDEHKKDFWYRMWIYQTRRLIMDLETSNPVGAALNFKTMLNSPIAATNTVNGLLYPIFGIGDITETIQRGPYQGWNKYGRNLLKYTTPFYDYIDQIYRMDEDDSAFKIFEKSNAY